MFQSRRKSIWLHLTSMVDQVHAGHEAAGTVLTYLMWKLSGNIETQNRLRDELKSSSDALGSELLNAILMETMCLYLAGFGLFPRVAPENTTVGGFPILVRTMVSASPYNLSRNSKVFPHSGSGLPERWIEASTDAKQHMRQWLWMFMSGQRIRVGEHLAVCGMKVFVGNPDMR